MKLEDIELQLGDKLTFDEGTIAFAQNGEYTTKYNWYNKNHLAKIERYKPISDSNEYILTTIWEKPTNDDIEELYEVPVDHRGSIMILDKLNEVIRKINEMGKCD